MSLVTTKVTKTVSHNVEVVVVNMKMKRASTIVSSNNNHGIMHINMLSDKDIILI